MKCNLCEKESTIRIAINISKGEWRDSQGMDLCNYCAKKILEAIQSAVRYERT